MVRAKNNGVARTLLYSFAVVSVAAFGLWYSASNNVSSAETQTSHVQMAVVPAATFNADAGSLGAIPDGTSLTPCSSVTPKNVTFTVSGLTGSPTNVETSITTAAPAHTFVGDLIATLIAPNGASFTVFGRTGATSAGSFGSGSDFTGPYNFKDSAAGTNWWTAAATTPVPPGDYRTTTPGPTTSPAPVTTMSPAFAGVANPNGTWTLRFQDCASGDTGSVSAANLKIDTAAVTPVQHVLDYNGDGKTDYVVVRNVGGGPGGQIRWFYNLNGTATTTAKDWGVSGDFFIDGNWDGDASNDIAVWRSGAPGVAAFYVLRSSDFTALVDLFGQTGDDPTVVDDYNNDGKTDFAVYRAGASAGLQSTWFWRSGATPGGAVNYVPWGQNGDFPAPGDYDGDGSADYVVQRNNGGGQAAFWRKLTTAGNDFLVFGTPTDVIVPGDYDGDGKTDVATIRGSAGSINWYYDSSSIPGVDVTQITFGASATDFTAQGDYDGDGKTDIAIWRPSATPGASAFWVRGSIGGAVTSVPFGQNGDYPVGDYNSH